MLGRAALLGIALAAAACTQQVVLEDVWDAGGTDLPVLKDGPLSPTSDAACGSIYLSLNYRARAAQLMVMLDRSLSMQSSLGTTTRESASESALIGAISKYQSKVKFGFEQFPADGSDKAYAACQHGACCAGSVDVEPQYNALNSISGPLECSDPFNSPCPTPGNDSVSSAALAQMRDYYKSKYPPSSDDRYLLLVTASEPSCSAYPDDAEACTNAIAAASDLGNLGIRIVVLSVGYQPKAGSCLVRISQTGSSLSPPADTTSLYSPSSVGALNSNVTEFVSAVARTGCTLDSNDVPPSGAQLVVSMGNSTSSIPQVDSTDQNGWSFANSAHTSITFSGTVCDQYVNSQYTNISVGYTCSTCGGATACPQW